MKNHYIRKLLFYLVECDGLVFAATGWRQEEIDNSKTVSPPHFLAPHILDDPEMCPIDLTDRQRYNFEQADHSMVNFLFDLLNELSLETLQSKTLEIEMLPHELKFAETHGVPISLATKDQKYWAKKFHWNADEAIMLSLGFSLKPELARRLGPLLYYKAFNRQYYPIIKSYGERAELMASTNAFVEKAVPLRLIRWMKRLEFIIPNNLERNVQHFQLTHDELKTEKTGSQSVSTDEPKPFLQSERTTALKLIAAMAMRGYKFKPQASRNEATSDIQSDLNFLGFEMDSKTILKWLREACELVEVENRPEEDS